MPTSGSIKRRENFFIAISGAFKQQAAVGTAMANADLNFRLPIDGDARPNREQTVEPIFDCDDVHIIENYVSRELVRWSIRIRPTAKLFAGFMAYAKGAAAAFAGSPLPEIQTLDATSATDGTYTLSMNFEGRSGTTVPIAYNASTAVVEAALEGMERPIEDGDIASVSGSLVGGDLAVTFGGRLDNVNLPLLTADSALLVGDTVNIVETQAGAGESSDITRSTSSALPVFSIAIGYEGDTSTYRKFKDQCVNRVTLNISKGEISSMDIEIIGSSKFTDEPTFSPPACVNYDPIRGRDIRLQVNSQWITGDVRNLTYTLDNQMQTDLDAYPFDSKFMSQFNRGFRQVESLNFAVDGSEADDLYTWAFDRNEQSVDLYFGPPSNRAHVDIPVCELSFGSPDVGFTANRGTFLNIVGEPHLDATLGTYSKVVYYEEAGTAFLAT